VTLEFLGCLVVLVLVVVGLLQAGIYVWARHVVVSATVEAARRSAEIGATPADGEALARASLHAGLGSVGDGVVVSVYDSDGVVVAEAGGHLDGIGPLPDLPLSARSVVIDEEAAIR
jgi:hypothetical protein